MHEFANPYSYVGSNPVNFTDPTGKLSAYRFIPPPIDQSPGLDFFIYLDNDIIPRSMWSWMVESSAFMYQDTSVGAKWERGLIYAVQSGNIEVVRKHFENLYNKIALEYGLPRIGDNPDGVYCSDFVLEFFEKTSFEFVDGFFSFEVNHVAILMINIAGVDFFISKNGDMSLNIYTGNELSTGSFLDGFDGYGNYVFVPWFGWE
jgi:hypothetical protein